MNRYELVCYQITSEIGSLRSMIRGGYMFTVPLVTVCSGKTLYRLFDGT
jgi:hypothetical protein